MAIKVTTLCLSLSLLIGSNAVNAKENYTSDQYLKNYALSVCLAKGYSALEVKNDAAAAARGYNEFGDYPIEAYTAVRNLAKKFLTRHYDSMSGEPMTLAKCIDFYHSRELDNVIAEYKDKS